jgi:hypothetical protein
MDISPFLLILSRQTWDDGAQRGADHLPDTLPPLAPLGRVAMPRFGSACPACKCHVFGIDSGRASSLSFEEEHSADHEAPERQ